jgi:large-conductance mechanosensitive channel
MAQEIITYLIVAAAFLFAFWKFYKKFSKKKPTDKLNNKQKQKQNNCSICTEECIFRDQSASTPDNADFCNKTYPEKS